jgi:hypothetical protein
MQSTDFPVVEPHRFGGANVEVNNFVTDGQGYIADSDVEEGVLRSRVRLFRSGVCEWGYRSPREDGFVIPTRTFTEQVHDALAYFASVYPRVGYHGRVRVWVGIEDAADSVFSVKTEWQRANATTTMERVGYLEDTNVDALVTDAMPVVHAAMDEIWQAYGYPACWLFQDGEYRPE